MQFSAAEFALVLLVSFLALGWVLNRSPAARRVAAAAVAANIGLLLISDQYFLAAALALGFAVWAAIVGYRKLHSQPNS